MIANTYIPEKAFTIHNCLQNSWMPSFSVVIVSSIQLGCYCWNVASIYCANTLWYSPTIMEKVDISTSLLVSGNVMWTGSNIIMTTLQNSRTQLYSSQSLPQKDGWWSYIYCQLPTSRWQLPQAFGLVHTDGNLCSFSPWHGWADHRCIQKICGTHGNSEWVVENWNWERLCPTTGEILGVPRQ